MRRIVAFLAGLGVASAHLSMQSVLPAGAQTPDPAIRSLPQRRPAQAAAVRPGATPPPVAGSALTVEPPPGPPSALRGRLDDPVAPSQPSTDGGPVAPRDGLLAEPEPLQLRDGIIETGEPAPLPEDGLAAPSDERTLEDRAAFEAPPAGADPQLFQIEEVAPLADRRIDRLFRFEPYEAIGVRIGSFVLFPELEIAGLATSNALRSPAAVADRALEVKPAVRIVSDWRAHAIELRARAI